MFVRQQIIDGAAAHTIEPISIRISEAVRVTGLSKSKIYQLIASGDIEAAKVGRATVVLVESLKSFLRSQRKRPRAETTISKMKK
jgi:excisionase family DNA binding protein